jgi:hypothetical protein
VSARCGLTLWLLAACGAEQSVAHFAPGTHADDFAAVSSMLGARCGTLDCHGQLARSLRIYSGHGLRLSPEDSSGHGGTRVAEHTQNLRSVYALEPELLQRVLAERGRDPYRLTLLRKATATELHRGGAALEVGDDGALCITSWLAGERDQDACGFAIDAAERSQ